MSWWGKLLGGAFGFMLGGPLGAILGAALGHNFDKGVAQAGGYGGNQVGDTERIQSAFFTATFSVMGHIAKADGRVSETEIKMANQIMSHMMLNDDQRELAKQLFNQGKRSDFDLDGILTQFKNECHRRIHLVQMFLEIQISTVLADREIHSREREIIHFVGSRLGVSSHIIDQLISMVQAQEYYAHSKVKSSPSARDIGEAYAVLGVDPAASDDEIKKAYRRLMNQHHPDKLVSKGLPEEMIKIATEKTQEIKSAYEQIRNIRKKH